ncbi:OmpW/AlkL family protein [Undibacterium oligocarboniphilum]|uniref:Outer membrane beta-barrel protein n=1 Tax=Undibacterium oligocarboniphilum TaxID=666702 RepID=A0A850QR03_9BURK|nr:OmpW family outer membrane protein [Undibacterium oligocarboniphilum]MBC3871317.1 outer membrane beta-barrel protein [Undibacterium oligocarboniphilum]NVO78814.1 outer membrane beta-barrel protein [Undibacterium oligocarboniphilum]
MKKTKIAAAILLGLLSTASFADEYNNTVKAGVIGVFLHPESPDFTSNGPAFLTPQPAGLTIGNATTVLFGFTHRLTDHLDFDLTAGLPPEHNVYGRGVLGPYGVIAKVKQRAPTVFINYNFGAASDTFRPYVGLGLNYTQFFDATATASNNIATGGPTKIDLKESFGLAAQIGARYKINERWSLIGSLATAKVKTDLTATTGSIERKTKIDFKPIAVTLGVGYSF